MKNSPPPRDSLLCPCVLRYALAALASPLLFARGSGFALTAHAMCLQLGLRPRSSCYALAAWASPSLQALRARGLLAARATGFALAVHAMRLPLGLSPRGSVIFRKV
jgi:hypothetical protein